MVSNSSGRSAGGTEAYQKPFFESLWQGGQQLQQQGGDYQQLQGQMGGLVQQGQQMQQNLQNNPYMGGSYQPSQAYESQLRAGGQAIAQGTEMMMHQSGQTGVQAGQFGASRGQLAEGLIGQGGVNAYAQLSGQLMGQDMQNQLGQAGIYAQSQLGGLAAQQGQAGMALGQANAPWFGLQNQAGLVGNAQSTASGRDTSRSYANK